MKRWLGSARFAYQGIVFTYQTQPNFKIEVCAALIALLLGKWLEVSLIPIIFCCALVLSLELLNTAVEAVVDLCSPEIHPLAKVAKDAAAGAVLLASIGTAFIGFILFWGPLSHKLSRLLVSTE